MNFTKLIAAVTFTLLVTMVFGQDAFDDKMQATKTKVFQMKEGDKTMEYKIKVYENRNYPYVKDASDNGNVNQDRYNLTTKVTKLIYVDFDEDNAYDRYIVMRYKKSADDTFEVVATKNGFGVKVDGKYVEYIIGEGTYHINSKDKDHFTIDEFMAI